MSATNVKHDTNTPYTTQSRHSHNTHEKKCDTYMTQIQSKHEANTKKKRHIHKHYKCQTRQKYDIKNTTDVIHTTHTSIPTHMAHIGNRRHIQHTLHIRQTYTTHTKRVRIHTKTHKETQSHIRRHTQMFTYRHTHA